MAVLLKWFESMKEPEAGVTREVEQNLLMSVRPKSCLGVAEWKQVAFAVLGNNHYVVKTVGGLTAAAVVEAEIAVVIAGVVACASIEVRS